MGGQVGRSRDCCMFPGTTARRSVSFGSGTRKNAGTFLFIARSLPRAARPNPAKQCAVGRCGPAQCHPAASHRDPPFALGVARTRFEGRAQKGSYVGPDKLTFDFSSAALTKPQSARSGEARERKDPRERARFMERNPLRRSEGARRHHAVLRRQIRRHRPRRADRRRA